MSLENAKVLHKHFLEIGRKDLAEQQEENYPELKEVPKEEPVIDKKSTTEKPKEVKSDGKKSTR